MESTVTENFAKTSHALADKAANQVQAGIHGAQSRAQQSLDAISDITDQARDMAANATDSIVSYTKKNPVRALAIAAASGAILYAAVKAFRSYRD
jgi:ElaB/YqjD/DUF883 family membrane-anchored ribosome-binding protein